jgi:alpha-glucosidase/alpha-D-xyloside xylohydrolase
MSHPSFGILLKSAIMLLALIGTDGICIADDARINVGGAAVELKIDSVSERTVCIGISPVDGEGRVIALPATAVFVPFQSVERLRLRELVGAKEIEAGVMRVVIKAQPLVITVRRRDGSLVQELTFDSTDGSFVFRTEAPVFGMGEGRQQFDRRGYYYDFANGQVQMFRTHGATIPVPFLIGVDGWAMFVHNPPVTEVKLSGPAAIRDANIPWGRFDLRGEKAGPPPGRNETANQTRPAVMPVRGKFIPRADTVARTPMRIFIVNVEKPTDAMEEYIRLAGHPAMPPKWVMGYMQSHRSLSGPGEVIEVARTMREQKLPCDALIYLGSGYTNDRDGKSGWNLGHGSLTFNPRVFDKPQEMIDRLHAMNYHVVLHKNAAPAGLFGLSVEEKSDSPLHISNYWATHTPLMKMGIDGWWPDDGDELPIENRLARLRLYYEGPLKDRPNERPWSLDRNGYAGAARFGAWIWSGDVQSRWVTLKNHVPVGVNFSMSVSPWWGTDIGGFTSSDEYTGELYVRWFQFAAFTPLFRSHGRNWHLHTPFGWNKREVGPVESQPPPGEAELHNAAVEPICRKFLELRYRLLPYNYTIVREACDTGVPPMRAMWVHYPQDAEASQLGDQYLWGQDILVAPVVEKGSKDRRVYLPKGKWYDWWDESGAVTDGGSWVTRSVDLATMPLYVRAGAIIPIDPVRQYTGQDVNESTTIRIYPGADGAFTLYDDDGHTLGYRDGTDGREIWIHFSWDDAKRQLTVSRDPRMKMWPAGTKRVFDVRVVGKQTGNGRVEFKGERIEMELP